MSDENKDVVAERREARRRKILQNMESRLNKIANPSITEDVSPKSNLFECRENSSDSDYRINTEKEKSTFFKEDPEFSETMEAEIPFLAPQTEASSISLHETDSTFLNFLLGKKFHLIFVALLTFLGIRCGMGHLFFNNILNPFLSVQLAHLAVSLTSSTESPPFNPLIGAALALWGVESKLPMLVLRITSYIFQWITDFFLYFFIYIMISHTIIAI